MNPFFWVGALPAGATATSASSTAAALASSPLSASPAFDTCSASSSLAPWYGVTSGSPLIGALKSENSSCGAPGALRSRYLSSYFFTSAVASVWAGLASAAVSLFLRAAMSRARRAIICRSLATPLTTVPTSFLYCAARRPSTPLIRLPVAVVMRLMISRGTSRGAASSRCALSAPTGALARPSLTAASSAASPRVVTIFLATSRFFSLSSHSSAGLGSLSKRAAFAAAADCESSGR